MTTVMHAHDGIRAVVVEEYASFYTLTIAFGSLQEIRVVAFEGTESRDTVADLLEAAARRVRALPRRDAPATAAE